MNNWKQVRIPLLALIFTAVVLVLVRVILVTTFPNKPKNNSDLPDLPLQIAAFIEAN
ncbi:MAG: hypothetical protein HC836_30110 [Richelia sp. RM2_1_2]|nr:hypothetical protein [Richelia sp. RM1_1_1]NJO31355.1 hypothetical protein [Richelia sp. SL_2_1]NJO62325.1 hypothetical protein [Richelia sp. RM2_1_2]